MRTLQTGTLLCLALGLALVACNRTESVAPTDDVVSPETLMGPKDAAFSMEAYAIKSREKDHAKIESGLRDLRTRYGYPVRSQEPAASAGVSGSGSQALGKTAVGTWFQARGVNVSYHFAHSRVVTVAANATLKVWGIQEDGGADPMVMGFYKSTGTNPSAYWIQFVGYNDDMTSGNLNSFFKWTNNTGAAKSVRLVSWCYPQTSGTTTMTYTISLAGSPTKSGISTMWVSGWMQFEPNPLTADYEGCGTPYLSRVIFTRDPVVPATGFGSSLVSFNEVTMRGTFMRDTDAGLTLQDLPQWRGSSFLLGYFEGDGYQPSSMDDDGAIGLLDAHYGGPLYHGAQLDRYNCP